MARDDLISRQAAMDAICKAGCDSGYCGVSCKEHMVIKNLPSVQPERKTGQWLKAYGDHEAFGVRPFYRYCSECNESTVWAYNFCPHCGADMRGEDHEIDRR